jgi:hypothetical protein
MAVGLDAHHKCEAPLGQLDQPCLPAELPVRHEREGLQGGFVRGPPLGEPVEQHEPRRGVRVAPAAKVCPYKWDEVPPEGKADDQQVVPFCAKLPVRPVHGQAAWRTAPQGKEQDGPQHSFLQSPPMPVQKKRTKRA